MYAKLDRACKGAFWNAPDDGDCAERLMSLQVRSRVQPRRPSIAVTCWDIRTRPAPTLACGACLPPISPPWPFRKSWRRSTCTTSWWVCPQKTRPPASRSGRERPQLLCTSATWVLRSMAPPLSHCFRRPRRLHSQPPLPWRHCMGPRLCKQEECHHGPHIKPSRIIKPAASGGGSGGGSGTAKAPAPGAEARLRERAARAQRLGAAYARLMRSHRGWPVTGALPKKGAPVKNWAHLLGGLGHNPPCTGESWRAGIAAGWGRAARQ
jgi:hypothetical protein